MRLMSEADIRAERLKKLELLQKAGMEGYPAESRRVEAIAEVLAAFDTFEKDQKKIHVSGRLMSRRGQGGIIFADLFDGSTMLTTGGPGRIQIVLQQAGMDSQLFDLFTEVADIGDFIDVFGVAFKTKRGERSIKVAKWRMLSKSLLPLPSEHFGIKDEETRLRQRAIGILLDPELRAMFERRARFWQATRQFLLARAFMEVETPVLETTPGGADARPFVTHHNALDIEVYLRISAGELWQKRLLIAGFPKVFEIGGLFRNEEQLREHLQDYTQLESYEAYSDMRKGMGFVQELYRHIAKEVYGKYTFEIGEHTVDFAEEWPVLDFAEFIGQKFNVDAIGASEDELLHAASRAGGADIPNKERAVDHLWKQVRKSLSGPAFLTGVPRSEERR